VAERHRVLSQRCVWLEPPGQPVCQHRHGRDEVPARPEAPPVR
jgi:hypothetical protein